MVLPRVYMLVGTTFLCVAETALEHHGLFDDRNVDMAMISDFSTTSTTSAQDVIFLPLQERANDVEPNYLFALDIAEVRPESEET